MPHPDLRDSESCFNYLVIYTSFYKGCFRRWTLRIANLLFGGGSSKSHAIVISKCPVQYLLNYINLYPKDNEIGFPKTYPLDSDLYGG